MKITITTLTCQRCAHRWVPRQPVVVMCPKCKSLAWNKPGKARPTAASPAAER